MKDFLKQVLAAWLGLFLAACVLVGFVFFMLFTLGIAASSAESPQQLRKPSVLVVDLSREFKRDRLIIY